MSDTHFTIWDEDLRRRGHEDLLPALHAASASCTPHYGPEYECAEPEEFTPTEAALAERISGTPETAWTFTRDDCTVNPSRESELRAERFFWTVLGLACVAAVLRECVHELHAIPSLAALGETMRACAGWK